MYSSYIPLIDSICIRLNNFINPVDVISWLENFEKEDIPKALITLNSFEFYTTNDIIAGFNNGLDQILKNTKPREKIYLIPVGNMLKSGSAMLYFLKKTPSYKKKNILIITSSPVPENDLKFRNYFHLKENCKIVMVDDFAGTGNSVAEFYNSIKNKLPENHTALALTVVYMNIAGSYLKNNNITIFGTQRIQAFADRGSVFGYYTKMLAIRDFCFKYGNILYPLSDFQNNLSKNHPLGYSNCQALVGFEHSVPNNTLPIFWADVYRKDNSEKWKPLFPRRSNYLIEKSKNFKQSRSYWLSLAYKLNLSKKIFNLDKKYDKDSLQLISIIYLKRKKRHIDSICQLLGINMEEYDLIMQKGKKKHLFDKNNELTSHGIRIYEEVNKLANSDSPNNKMYLPNIEEDILYIPKIFRGSS